MSIRKYFQILPLLFLLIAVGFGAFRGYQLLASHPPGILGNIKLSVSSNALPEGVDKNQISTKVLNVFELPETVRQTAGEDIVMAAMGLEPSGTQFLEPVSFTIKVFASHKFTPKIWQISKQGVEEINDLQIAFNQNKDELTVTGKVNHFSQLITTKTESDEEWGEFIVRGREEIAYYEQKAAAAETPAERAKLYKDLSDRGRAWAKDDLDRFNGSFFGRDEFNESSNYAEYVKSTQDYYEDLVKNKADPNRRLEIFDEWFEKINEMGTEGGKIWRDTRVGTEVDPGINYRFIRSFFELGGFEVIELSDDPDDDVLIRYPFPRPGPGKLALLDLDDEIKRTKDPYQKLRLLKHRLERTEHFKTILHNGNFDERIVPEPGRDDLGETSILRDMSISIVNDYRRLIDKEANPERRRQLAKEYLDAVEWLRKEWQKGGYDKSKAPDKEMLKWPDSITDILKAQELPTQAPQRPIPPGASKEPVVPTTRPRLECNFEGFIKCRDQFDLQGCIYACPLVAKPCPEGTSPGTECKVTDEACSNDCWNKGTAQGIQCAELNHCTQREIEDRLRGQ